MLERIGISLERSLLEQFDRLIERRGYVNRSEAVRDLIREQLVEGGWSESESGEAVAVVAVVYDHGSSGVARKLAQLQHESHRAVVSSLHVHMDAHNCLEVLVLRGRAADVVRLAEGLVSTRGVKYGKIVPATTGETLR
jgi:CopG family nickel-responsive transcriptional regulator